MKKGVYTPKAVYVAIIILTMSVAFVAINTAILSKTIKEIEESTVSAPLTLNEFDALYDDFLKVRTYLSISVDHDDIATVETGFAEIRGALAAGDEESAAIAKSRLCSALGHLRRLSGFNIDSII